MQQIHVDFEAAVNTFKAVPYDILDVGKKQFDDDFYEFRCRIKVRVVARAVCVYARTLCHAACGRGAFVRVVE